MSGNLFDAAYMGMSIAAKNVAERIKKGLVECNLCGREMPASDPFFVKFGWCEDCNEDDIPKPTHDDAVCKCCMSQAAEEGDLCLLCWEIKQHELENDLLNEGKLRSIL